MNKFLKKKGINISLKTYGIDALGRMAYGLFASLLVGTILNTLGKQLNIAFLTDYINPATKAATGAAIAVSIASALKAPNLVLFSSTVVGVASYELGGPVGTYVRTIFAVEFGKLVSKSTRLDILITPITTIIVGSVIGYFIGPPLNQFMTSIGDVIKTATNMEPFLMGIVVSVIMGMLLTLPVSSAAIAMMLGLEGLAAGAAVAGCAAQMVGFAVMSYKDNKMGGVLAVGLGTSMLHISNIIKNWKIWIPPTFASMIVGPVSTMVFKMTNTPLGAGMGTCGLVGQIEGLNAMLQTHGLYNSLLSIVLVHVVLPGIITYIVYYFMLKKGYIKDGDLKLEY